MESNFHLSRRARDVAHNCASSGTDAPVANSGVEERVGETGTSSILRFDRFLGLHDGATGPLADAARSRTGQVKSRPPDVSIDSECFTIPTTSFGSFPNPPRSSGTVGPKAAVPVLTEPSMYAINATRGHPTVSTGSSGFIRILSTGDMNASLRTGLKRRVGSALEWGSNVSPSQSFPIMSSSPTEMVRTSPIPTFCISKRPSTFVEGGRGEPLSQPLELVTDAMSEHDSFTGLHHNAPSPLLSAPKLSSGSGMGTLRRTLSAFCLLNALLGFLFAWMMESRCVSFDIIATRSGWNPAEKARTIFLAAVYYLVMAVVCSLDCVTSWTASGSSCRFIGRVRRKYRFWRAAGGSLSSSPAAQGADSHNGFFGFFRETGLGASLGSRVLRYTPRRGDNAWCAWRIIWCVQRFLFGKRRFTWMDEGGIAAARGMV